MKNSLILTLAILITLIINGALDACSCGYTTDESVYTDAQPKLPYKKWHAKKVTDPLLRGDYIRNPLQCESGNSFAANLKSKIKKELAGVDRIEKKGFAKRPMQPMDKTLQGPFGLDPKLSVGGFTAPTMGYTFSVAVPQLPSATNDAYDVRSRLSKDESKWPTMWPVEDQEKYNNCVCNAVIGALEFDWYLWNANTLVQKERAKGIALKDIKLDLSPYRVHFSRLFLWYNAKDGNTDNIGTTVREGIYAFAGDGKEHPYHKKGCCLRATWDYTNKMSARPSEDAYFNALQYQVHKDVSTGKIVSDLMFQNLADTGVSYDTEKLTAIKGALLKGLPVPFGMFLQGQAAVNTFMPKLGPSLINTPTGTRQNYVRGSSTPGHSMLIVGYDDSTRQFTVRNSYGPGWRNGGYCYISYDYLLSDWAADFWIMQRP